MSEVVPFRHRSPPPPVIDEPDILAVTIGGRRSALNLTAPTVIKAMPGRLNKLIVIDGGTGGAFTLNDCAAVAAAAASNTIFTLAEAAAPGTVIDLDWPCSTGIVLSAVPNAGVLAVSYA